MKTPASTYRLQLHEGFTLHDAETVTGYLHTLGVDWLYLSPILKAEEGSSHGYDVTDPRLVDPERGGASALASLSAKARSLGMGVLADIVPNHLGVATPAQNPWWWSLLRQGQESEYASYFDVDWAAGGGRILLPVLGEDSADEAPLEVVDGPDGLELRYYDHRFPVAEGTGDGEPVEVHARQNYELVSWRRADTDLNYRRFFAVNTLAGLRVEDPGVFDAAHAEPVRWIREGLVDGLRIDHPDGLAQPGAYLERLAEQTDGAYVLVEKILEPGEELPPSWRCAGTSGYDALAMVNRLFVDPRGQSELERISASRTTIVKPDYPDLIHGTKRHIADTILGSEMRRLARLVPATAGLTFDVAVDAFAELTACLPVYRTYLPFGREYLLHAVKDANRRRPDLSGAIDTLQPLLEDIDGESKALAVRFQQTSGMVMAKGVEDTAFYRYDRLVSLNEVGADPSLFSITVDQFHAEMLDRLATRSLAMTTLSTHDTKRSEDVRARISVLSEVPVFWGQTVNELAEAAPLADGELANLLWQSFIGVWPASRDRLHAYAEKASREASSSTTWTEPNVEFEEQLHAMVDAAFDDEQVMDIVERSVEHIRAAGWSNSLSSKLVQLTMPGIPDVYQGTELWDYSLVDPDNRRPVDFELRRKLLQDQDQQGPPPIDETGAAKLRIVSRTLRTRRENPELFNAYTSLEVSGPASDHLIAYDSGGAITLATRLPFGLEKRGGWKNTEVMLPKGNYRDAFTDTVFSGGAVPATDLLAAYPVALLTREREETA